jgi:hypothetical protein
MTNLTPHGKNFAYATISGFLSFLFIYITFWPGIADGDSLELIWYARAGYFSTYQSPLLGGIWQMLDNLGGYHFIHLAQSLFVSFAVSFFLVQFVRGWSLLVLVPLAVMNPSIAPYAGALVKDVWFGCTILIGLTCYWRFRQSGGLSWLMAFALTLVFALHFRPNGTIVIFPVLIDCLIRTIKSRNWIRSFYLPAGLTLFSVIVSLNFVTPFIGLFYKIDYRPAEQTIYLSDLAAISLETKNWLIPKEANPDNIGWEQLEEKFNPYSVGKLIAFKESERDKLIISQDPHVVEIYKNAWLNAIAEYPLVFLNRRWDVGTHFWGIGQSAGGWFYQKVSGQFMNDPFFERRGWSDVYLRIVDWMEENTSASLLWPYALLIFVVMAISAIGKQPDKSIVILTGGTGLIYSFGFSLIAPHVGYRYFWPTSLIASVLVVYLIYWASHKAINKFYKVWR